MPKEGPAGGIPWTVVWGFAGAAMGTLATLLVQRIFPEARPGDGFVVRWSDASGQERRVEFGDEEAEALRRAVELAGRGLADVEVVEVRHGSVVAVQKAGQTQKLVTAA